MSENQVNKEHVLKFRQTFNVTYKRWGIPKRLVAVEEIDTLTGVVTKKEVWRKITGLDRLITKRDGISYALWRLQKQMNAVTVSFGGCGVWESKKIIKVASKTDDLQYSIFYLTLTRIKRDMYGGMDAPA